MLKKYNNVYLKLFISEKIYSNLKILDSNLLNNIDVFIYSNSMFYSFFDKIRISIKTKKLDGIIINSLIGGRRDYFSFLFIRPKCKYFLIDANGGKPFLGRNNEIKGGLFLEYLIRKILLWHLNSADRIIYQSRDELRIAEKYSKKKLLFLPFTYYLGPIDTQINVEKKKIVFTVTGGIEKKRKDYDIFFQALDILFKRYPNLTEEIKIVFLGTIKTEDNKYGLSIIEKVKMYNKVYNGVIEFFEELFIHENIYREKIHNTDVILSTINLDYYSNGKGTSGVTECVAHGIPFLYPKGFKFHAELNSSSLMYDSAITLAKQIANLSLDKNSLIKIKSYAKQNSNKFSIEEYGKLLNDFIMDALLEK